MLYLVLFLILVVVTQVILKAESRKKNEHANTVYVFKMLLNPRVIFAYMLSILNIFIWILALTKVSLFRAFMVTSFSFVLMLIVDKMFFNEEITSKKLIGVIVITIGVVLSLY